MNECKLNLEIIELSIKLEGYVKKDNLTLFRISRAYFEITKVIFEVLSKHVDKLKNLKIAYKEILELVKCIQSKNIERLEDENLLPITKDNLRSNWNNLIINLGFLSNQIQNQEEAKFKNLTIILSSIALILSILAILATVIA
jgi:hypothetical protein